LTSLICFLNWHAKQIGRESNPTLQNQRPNQKFEELETIEANSTVLFVVWVDPNIQSYSLVSQILKKERKEKKRI
jgi:hypothetical protein